MTGFVTHTGHKAFVLHEGHKAFLTQVEVAPPPADLDVAFSMTNRAGASAAQPKVTFGHPFHKGAIPAGSHVALFAADGTTSIAVQQDRESYWKDGSLKFAALSFNAPDAFTDGQKIAYHLKGAAGAPSRNAGANTLAALTTAHDFKVTFSGGDCGPDTFTVSVNTIVANGRLAPAFGVNPLDGFEVCKAGPLCTEWRFWSYLRRDSDNGYHAWVKANIWVRSWGAAGPYQITGLVTHPNCWGPHPAGTVAINGGAPPRLAANIVLQDGATALHYWGGPNDVRSRTMSATDFDVANGWITLPSGGASYGQGVTFSGSGLPSAVVPGGVYWIGSDDPAGRWQLNTYLYDISADLGGGAYTPWQPLHHYDPGTLVSNVGARYLSIDTAGTSAASGGPSGVGTAIVDGTVTWTAITAPFGTAGSGSCQMNPIPVVHLHCGVALTDDNGHPIWVGTGTQPKLVPTFDLDYLYHQSRMFPPFRTDLPGYAYPYAPPIAGYNVAVFGWDLGSTGDNPGDDRIGYLQHTTMNAMLSDDAGYDAAVRMQALWWVDYHLHYEDERCGWAITTNNGPAGDGVAYPNLAAPQPEAFAYGNPDYSHGLLVWTANATTDSGYAARYNVWAGEQSHLPALWPGPYLRTGHDIYLHLGLGEAIAVQLATGYRSDTSGDNGGRSWYGVTAKDGQTRGLAWGTKAFALAEHVCPAGHAIQPMMADCMDDTAGWLAAWADQMRTNWPDMAACGAYNGGNPQVLWQLGFCFMVYATEALKDERPGWRDFLTNYLNAVYPAMFDDSNGGSSYHIGAYGLTIPGFDGSHPGVNTPAEVWNATYGAAWVDSPTGLAASDQPFSPATDYQLGAPAFPWPTTSYQIIDAYGGVLMAKWLSIPRAAEIWTAIKTRIDGAGGVIWSGHSAAGSYSAFDASYPVFAIAEPPATP